MSRPVEGPWFRTGLGTWYATVRGRMVSLRVKGRENEAAAWEAWRRLTAGSPPAPGRASPPPAADLLTVRGLVDTFLADAATRLKPATVRLYTSDLTQFVAAVGGRDAADLTARDVAAWVHSLAVAATTKAIMLRSVSACLGWAVRNDLLAANVARKVAKPRSRSRSADAVISDADHAKLMAVAAPGFRLVLRVLHATGCRPGEACRVTTDTFDAAAACVVLPEHKGDRTGKARVVFLPPELVEELKGLAARHGSGPLLRTRRGTPYTAREVTKSMRHFRKKAGVTAIAYGYRHTFATAALAAGVPDAQVAALLGHSSTAVLHRHYSHLTQQAVVLREAMSRVRPPDRAA